MPRGSAPERLNVFFWDSGGKPNRDEYYIPVTDAHITPVNNRGLRKHPRLSLSFSGIPEHDTLTSRR